MVIKPGFLLKKCIIYDSDCKRDAYINQAVVLITSVIAWLAVYGYYVLDPFYTDWLMSGGDLSQHYLGWIAFLKGDWMFPIGMTDYLAYPVRTSVIFTDSIPLFAVPFKLLRDFTDAEIQFFGFWGIMCFILTGFFTVMIFNRFYDNRLSLAAISLFFILCPIMLFRMYAHTSLAAHWIILMGLEPVVNYKPSEKRILFYLLYGCLAASIHIYFVPICLILVTGYCIASLVNETDRSTLVRCLSYLLVFIASVGLTIGLLGGFSGNFVYSTQSLTNAALNLNAYFDPSGWSVFLADRPAYVQWWNEGFSYLGLGIMVALILAIGGWLIIKPGCNRGKVTALVFMFLIAYVFALSPEIAMDDKLVFHYELPDALYEQLTIFRSTGRFNWICVYIIMTCCFICLSKTYRSTQCLFILLITCVLQIYDIHPQLVERQQRFKVKQEYVNEFEENSQLKELCDNDPVRHIYYTGFDIDKMYAMADFALGRGITVNDFYFAREIEGLWENMEKALQNEERSSLFIIPKSMMDEYSEYDELELYDIGDYMAGRYR